MSYVSGCVGLLIGLAFIGVGASVVRAAKPASGYLLVAAGLLELVTTCCVGALYSAPGRAAFTESGVGYDELSSLYAGVGVMGMLVDLVVGGLFVASILGLAKAAREAKPG